MTVHIDQVNVQGWDAYVVGVLLNQRLGRRRWRWVATAMTYFKILKTLLTHTYIHT